MSPEISIIIPVYKVEQYIRRSLDSVLCQTFSDIEVILIDDGSPDNCGKICDEYAEKDSRVKVIHQKNAGASAARNSGLESASGRFVGFVDSDDCIAPDMFELLHRHLKSSDADFAMCEYTEIDESVNSIPAHLTSESSAAKTLNVKETLEIIADSRKKAGGYMWNKLFRRDLVKELRLDPQIRVCHDMDYLMKALALTNKTVYLPIPLYGYFVQRSGALTSNADHDLDLEWNLESYHRDVSEIMDEFGRKKPELRDLASAVKCMTGDMPVANAMVRVGKIDRNTAEIIRSDIRVNLGAVIRSGLPFYKKMQMILFLISPDLYKLLYRILRVKQTN